jgi:hypothetical protein
VSETDERDSAAVDRGEPRLAPRAELVFAVALLIFAGSLLAQAFALPFLSDDGTIGAGFFPISLGVLVVIELVAYIAMVVRWGIRDGWRGDPDARLVSMSQALLLGIVVLGMALGEWIGIIGVVALILYAGLLLVDRARPVRAVLVATGTLIVIVLIFDIGLGLNLGLDLPF